MVQWWKATPNISDRLIPDGTGGGHAAYGPYVIHFGSNGDVDQATQLDWSGAPALNTHASIDENGNIRVLGWVVTALGNSISYQVLDLNGSLLEARTYGPVVNSFSTFEPVSLAEQHLQIPAGDRFINLDASGNVASAYKILDPSPIDLDFEFPSADQGLLVGASNAYTDFFGNVTYIRSILRTQENMSAYCDMEPFAVTRVDPPLSSIIVTDVSNASMFNYYDLLHSSAPVSFTVQPIAVPLTSDLCGLLAVPSLEDRERIQFSSTVLPGGGSITLTSTVAGRYALLDASGRLCSTGRLNQNGTTLLSGSGLSQGIYILRADDQNGRLIDATKLMVE